MNRCVLILLWMAAVAGAHAAEGPSFHVAPPPLGNDVGEGSAAAPFATLDRARLAVRAYLASHEMRSDVVVTLHAGTYELPAPVRFDAVDSGKNGAYVVYRAAPGGEVVLSGGRRVENWTPDTEGVFKTSLHRDVDFRQLWIDDRRAVRARSPNVGRMFRFAAEKKPDGFEVPTEQLSTLALRPNEVEFSVLIAWMHKRLRIARTYAEGDVTRAIIAPGEWDGVINQPQGDRVYLGRSYWLENAREFLDAPGEFFLDRQEGVLRYRPRPGEDLAHTRVIRPELESLIVLDGRLDAPVHHLRFEGLTLAHTGWTRPNHFGFVDVQANSLVPASPADRVDPQYRHNQRKDRIPAAFQATTSDHIVLRGNHFARLGGAGVVFTRGGNDNIIEQNSFFDLAAGGIEFGEDAVRPTDPRLFPRRNRIANNFISHIGQDYFGSVAILGYYTDASLITHNEIAALPYTGISQGWGWGNPGAPPDSRANRITYNHLTNFMRRLDDGGGIYTTDRQLGSEIAYNFIERMTPPDAHTKAGGALYPDQFTEGFHLHHNVTATSLRWLFLWNPNIRGNRVNTNYADTPAQRNDSPDNEVEPVNVTIGGQWPDPARAIIAAAGLESGPSQSLEIAAPTDVIIESASLDFQILSGEWTTTDAPADRYGAYVQQSTDSHATARWMPVLPRGGSYEVSVWLPNGSAAAVYTVRHADGETRLTLPAETKGGRWFPLGRHRFKAGTGGELSIAAAPNQGSLPLRVDAVRFELQTAAGN